MSPLRSALLRHETRARGTRPGPSGPGRGLDAHCYSLVHLYTSENAQVVALRGVDLDIDSGEMVALLGPSGTGKSTLLKLLGGLIHPTAGRIVVDGRDLRSLSATELRLLRATEIGIVLQDAGTNLLPYATSEQNVWFAQIGARRAGRAVQDPEAVLAQLDLGELSGERVNQLSGGAQQLVALAVGVATRPNLLLVDEPTSQLDDGGPRRRHRPPADDKRAHRIDHRHGHSRPGCGLGDRRGRSPSATGVSGPKAATARSSPS